MEINKIYCMDCLEGMKSMENDSIDLTVTSPPYDNLRKYNGYSFDFENVAKELYRVTKQGGVVVWIVGDATIKGSETGTSFKQALFFKEIGFNLHDTMIFLKANPVPQFKTKRYTNSFEYMFVFSKGKIETCNYLKEPTLSEGRKHYRGNNSAFSQQSADKPREEITTVKNEKIKGNVWTYGVGGTRLNHPAVFPEKLAEDHILSWSNPGDVIFDPFLGSGTTAKMAKLNGRNYIGFEISEEYVEVANKRIANC